MNDLYEQKPIDWREWAKLLARRRWWLLGPFFAVSLLSVIVVQLWPQLYRSEALILVEEQKVPEQYVTPNVVADPQDRLQSMTQQILSRTRLRRLIDQFNLYAGERSRRTMDELIDKMRTRIRIELVQAPGRGADLTAFRIYFSAESPSLAQNVTNEITSLFIEENLRARAQQSIGTTDFLTNQLEQARKDLAEQEERQRQYKMRYLGQLPEQQQSNLQILSSLEAQLRANTDALERAEQQKVYLESLRSEYQALRRDPDAGQLANSPAALTVEETRRQLTEMEAKYTARHPDVVRLRRQLASQEAGKDAADAAGSGGRFRQGATAVSDIEAQSRLKAITAEIESRKKDTDELRRRIREFQGRLDMTPVREQQLAEVTRSYENSRQYYQSLLQKKLQSELATNLEKRQQGEQFRILDPATLPLKPSQPNRLSIVLVGWLLGLCIGIGALVARELTDGAIRSERDVSAAVKMPVLIHIPLLHTPAAEARQRVRRLAELAGIAAGFALCAVVGIHTYLAG